ncbi:hypothetical protein NHX12_022101 [Muraenolepis orangiensis]|uniref:Uncharacterized protein n=1 Tax=Muraenolepis orangiensis TaxID=630683 RepID=A0A9Q0ESX9_9TELE|nr:hypothetical protein NHX12_022101 [Muraenolepis orangiensis]
MYLPSCTYYVSNSARQSSELRPVVNSPFLGDNVVVNSVQQAAACTRDPVNGLRDPVHGLRDPVHGLRDPVHGLRDPVHGLRDPVHGLRDYGSAAWLENSSPAKLPDYRHYCYEPRQQYRHQSGKWSVYHHHQTNHHHHHHHLQQASSPSSAYSFSPDEPVYRDSQTDGVFNHTNGERFLGYDHAGMVYAGGGHGATRYHTSAAFGDSNAVGSAARPPLPPATTTTNTTSPGLSGSVSKPLHSGVVPSVGRNRILPPGFDAFIIEAADERDKSHGSPVSPETGADLGEAKPGEEMGDDDKPSDPFRAAGTQGEDSPSSNEDHTKEPSMCYIHI